MAITCSSWGMVVSRQVSPHPVASVGLDKSYRKCLLVAEKLKECNFGGSEQFNFGDKQSDH